MTAINLDGFIAPEELEDLASSGKLSLNQREYALLTAKAMRARLRGAISIALLCEGRAEQVYSLMNEQERW